MQCLTQTTYFVPVSDDYYHLSFIFFFSLKESRIFCLHLWIIFITSEIIYDHSDIKDTSLRMQWREYARWNPNYLFCAHIEVLSSPSFYILLHVDRVMHDHIVSRNAIWSSRNKRLSWRAGSSEYARPKLNYLCCAHFR